MKERDTNCGACAKSRSGLNHICPFLYYFLCSFLPKLRKIQKQRREIPRNRSASRQKEGRPNMRNLFWRDNKMADLHYAWLPFVLFAILRVATPTCASMTDPRGVKDCVLSGSRKDNKREWRLWRVPNSTFPKLSFLDLCSAEFSIYELATVNVLPTFAFTRSDPVSIRIPLD